MRPRVSISGKLLDDTDAAGTGVVSYAAVSGQLRKRQSR